MENLDLKNLLMEEIEKAKTITDENIVLPEKVESKLIKLSKMNEDELIDLYNENIKTNKVIKLLLKAIRKGV